MTSTLKITGEFYSVNYVTNIYLNLCIFLFKHKLVRLFAHASKCIKFFGLPVLQFLGRIYLQGQLPENLYICVKYFIFAFFRETENTENDNKTYLANWPV